MINGFVAPGFEPVKKIFEDFFKEGREEKSQLCVYLGNEVIVDLWGSIAQDSPFGPDHLIPVFSSSKSLTSIVVASLVDKNLLDYNMTIADLWPEFAYQGKTAGTLADLMRHELGLPFFDQSLRERDLLVVS